MRDVSTQKRPGRIAQNLSSTVIEVRNKRWKNLAPYAVAPARTAALRPVGPEDVVGNTEYMQAALRLARDVAGYDFQAGTNPKRLNPVLFALGRPGCGKTLVAHAVGNYFTRYCDERSIPSRFVVIRRSDWASSYQNASAANLIRIFREVHEFEGVSGIYWADIDTALATRGQSGMRSEEKANLSAAFNVFDGTLIPFDGKWFMLCDANNLDMDDALKSRIARNPFRVLGPETVADHVRLLRDILLADFLDLVGADDAEWEEIGRIALDGGISGRGLEGISRQIIDHIQDFEYPDAYYDADIEERRLIIRDCSNPVDAAFVRAALRNYLEFEKDEEERVARQRFDDAVADAVFGLEVQKEVFGRVSET